MKLNTKYLFSYSSVYLELFNDSLQQRPQCSCREEIWWCFMKYLLQFLGFFFLPGAEQRHNISWTWLIRDHVSHSQPYTSWKLHSKEHPRTCEYLKHQLSPKVHVCMLMLEARLSSVRFPNKCYITVTAYNHPITCDLLIELVDSRHEGFHPWVSFISCYMKRTAQCHSNIPHTVPECHGVLFRSSRFSPPQSPQVSLPHYKL